MIQDGKVAFSLLVELLFYSSVHLEQDPMIQGGMVG